MVENEELFFFQVQSPLFDVETHPLSVFSHSQEARARQYLSSRIFIFSTHVVHALKSPPPAASSSNLFLPLKDALETISVIGEVDVAYTHDTAGDDYVYDIWFKVKQA